MAKIHKVVKKYFDGDKIGIHEIVKDTGVREILGRKHRTFDRFYEIKCTLCGHVRETGQKALQNGSTGPSYYCFYCPPRIQAEGKRRKKQEYDQKRRYENTLNDEDQRLFRLAIFGDLA